MTDQEKKDSFDAVYAFLQNAGLLRNNPNRKTFDNICVKFDYYDATIEIDVNEYYNTEYALIYYANNNKKINTKETLCEWDNRNKTLIVNMDNKKIKIKIK